MRYFGAVGHPPERFYRAAVNAFIVPSKANMDTLRALWKKLTSEEREVFHVSSLVKPRTEEQVRTLCRGIIDAYIVRRSWEMTPAPVRRVRQALRQAGYT